MREGWPGAYRGPGRILVLKAVPMGSGTEGKPLPEAGEVPAELFSDAQALPGVLISGRI